MDRAMNTLSRRSLVAALPALAAGCATARASDQGTGQPPGSMAATPGPTGPLADFPRAPAGPPLPAGPVSRIAVTSCSREDEPMPLYDDVRAARPDLVLMVGDNVYGSWTPEDPQLSDLRSAYFQLARRPEFQALAQQVPVVPVWDDHDYGTNDGGGDFAHKALAQAMFNTFWNIPADSPQRTRPGIYRSHVLGPPGQRVQLIVLDTRFFRDPLVPSPRRGEPGMERYVPHPPEATADILGPAQWAWLERELQVPAELRILVSSIQVVADGHGWERWGNFPAARDRLYRLIAQTGAKGVVFASGDRHVGSINRIADGVAYPLVDLTGSGINVSGWRPGQPTEHVEGGPLRIGPAYRPPNFGQFQIDWPGRQLRASVMGAGSVEAVGLPVSFADLGLV